MSTATPGIGISRLGQVSINVHDLDRAIQFYRDTLGLPLLFTAGGMAFFDCAGVRLMLARPEKPEFDHPSSILYFTVPHIEPAYRQMLGTAPPSRPSRARSRKCQPTICGWPSFATRSRICWRL